MSVAILACRQVRASTSAGWWGGGFGQGEVGECDLIIAGNVIGLSHGLTRQKQIVFTLSVTC